MQKALSLRSLLFVPGDRPERFAKAAASGADAIILDLEDSVSEANKPKAREEVASFLGSGCECPTLVRVNELASSHIEDDLATILPCEPFAIMLPKAEGKASIDRLVNLMGDSATRILPIAAETPAAIFQLGTFAELPEYLLGLTWGAEDMASSLGAKSGRQEDGTFTQPLQLARNLTLFGARAAGVQAIDTVYRDIQDVAGLADYAREAVRDGFTGILAIHPDQVMVINREFAPTEEQLLHAKAVVEAFSNSPEAGVLRIDGKMVDRPHLLQAERLLREIGED